MALLTLPPRQVGQRSRWLLNLGLLLAAMTGSSVKADLSRETQIKAVYLFNFTQYVSWPTDAFAGPADSFVIGVLGPDPLAEILDKVVQGESVEHHPIVTQRFLRIEDVRQCHILFISATETNNVEHLLAQLQGRRILTVSDADHFAARGGMIRFVTESNKIRLLINVEAARVEGLTISSKLLRLAEKLGPRQP